MPHPVDILTPEAHCYLTLKTPVVTICTTRFNIPKLNVLPTQYIYVFCIDLRTKSDYFPLQH
jgi:hypothetical protein